MHNKYQHLDKYKNRIFELFPQLDSFQNDKAKDFFFNLYYRECGNLPAFISRYSSEELKEEKTKQYIAQKIRCPGCLKQVETYFSKYIKTVS